MVALPFPEPAPLLNDAELPVMTWFSPEPLKLAAVPTLVIVAAI